VANVSPRSKFLVREGLNGRRHHIGNRQRERLDHRHARDRRLGRVADGAERGNPGEQPDGTHDNRRSSLECKLAQSPPLR
jgi:hypothetical protein